MRISKYGTFWESPRYSECCRGIRKIVDSFGRSPRYIHDCPGIHSVGQAFMCWEDWWCRYLEGPEVFRRWPKHSEDGWSIQRMNEAFRGKMKLSEAKAQRHSEDGRRIRMIAGAFKRRQINSKESRCIQKTEDEFRWWPMYPEDGGEFRRWLTHSKDGRDIQKMVDAFRRWPKMTETFRF